MLRLFVLFTAVCLLAPQAGAHTVPTITVEAEFSAAREITLRVNLDPRLFLSAQPTSLPPVPASWWLEQNPEAQTRSVSDALALLGRTVRFQIGDTPLAGNWKVTAIDSASAFPLGPNSAETHLLAEHRGPLPDVPGDFTVALDSRAPVGLILLNSVEGKAERRPQAIFPGETSRGFKVPERTGALAPPASTTAWRQASATCCDGLVQSGSGSRHFAGDHLLVVLALAAVLGGRIIPGTAMIASFQASHVVAALAVAGGWMPEAPLWMRVAGWTAIAAGLYLAHRRQRPRAAACFFVAGLCHGLDVPHLHLPGLGAAEVWHDAGLTAALQMTVLVLAGLVHAVATRGRRGGKAGIQPC